MIDDLYHRLNPVAGLRHNVLVEVTHHLLDPHHQGSDNVDYVVMGFFDK
jgi:hypothetical protein